MVIFLILLILLEGTNFSLAADSRAYGKSSLRTTAAGTESYTWDYENRLTALTKPGVGSYSYKYDHRARRVMRDESLAGGLKTFLSFSGGSSVQERSAAGVLITELIRGSDWGGGVGGILYSIRSGFDGVSPRITTNSRWGQSAHHHKLIDAVVEVVEKLAWHGR